MFSFDELALPIIQAPMAGGVSTPALVAAVANAGAIGSFGFAYSTPEKIDADLRQAKALTKGFVNANFFVFEPLAAPEPTQQQQAIDALKKLPVSIESEYAAIEPPFYPSLEQQLEPVWTHRPAILTFHFGLVPASIIEQAHALGIAVGITATNLEQAQAIENNNADFIVAQGIEAGGHRGTFATEPTDDSALSAIELTALIRAHCHIPTVTAGGIMDGADINQALHAGARAAQLGTAFVCCDESGATQAHKTLILEQPQRGSVLTKSFSGRWARGIRNEFIDLMQEKPTLPFPLQNTLTGPLRQWAARANNGEYQSLWAGSGYWRARAMPAAALLATLAQELHQAQQ